MSSAPQLHVAAPFDDGAQECARCSAVLSAQPGAARAGVFVPSALVVMSDGHYSSARLASPEELRAGALCDVKMKTLAVSLHFGGGQATVTRRGPGAIQLAVSWGHARSVCPVDMIATVDEAKALCQALRECIAGE